MRRFLLLPLVVLAALLTGCNSQNAQAVDSPDTRPVGQLQVEPTATAMAVEVVEEAQLPVDECVACHTDRQRLTDTAEPEDEGGEAESSGVG
jgi:hypothetical protein